MIWVWSSALLGGHPRSSPTTNVAQQQKSMRCGPDRVGRANLAPRLYTHMRKLATSARSAMEPLLAIFWHAICMLPHTVCCKRMHQGACTKIHG